MSGHDRGQHPRTDQQMPYSLVDKQHDMTRQFPQYAPAAWQHPSQDGYVHQLPPLTGAAQFVASPQSQYPQAEYAAAQYQYNRAPSYPPDMGVDDRGYDSPASRRRGYGHEPGSTPRGFQHSFPTLPPVQSHDGYPPGTAQGQQWMGSAGGPHGQVQGQQHQQQQQQPQTPQNQSQQQQQQQQAAQPSPIPALSSSTPKGNLKHLPGSLMDSDPGWETGAPQQNPQGEHQHRSMVGQPGMPDPAPSRGAKQRFTTEDDDLLRQLKEVHNLSWTQIADFFPDRRSGTLQVRYCTKIKKREENWTEENINKLKSVVDDVRSEFWTQVAGRVGKGFTAQTCRDKWEELEAIDREHEQQRLEQESTQLAQQSEASKRDQQQQQQYYHAPHPSYRT